MRGLFHPKGDWLWGLSVNWAEIHQTHTSSTSPCSPDRKWILHPCCAPWCLSVPSPKQSHSTATVAHKTSCLHALLFSNSSVPLGLLDSIMTLHKNDCFSLLGDWEDEGSGQDEEMYIGLCDIYQTMASTILCSVPVWSTVVATWWFQTQHLFHVTFSWYPAILWFCFRTIHFHFV